MYASVIGQAPVINFLFQRLQKKLAAELRFQEEIMKTKGALTMILASTSAVLT
jgi:U3 small nucleolar RNA-associated protein 15